MARPLVTVHELKKILEHVPADAEVGYAYLGTFTAWRLNAETGRVEFTTDADVNVVREGWRTP